MKAFARELPPSGFAAGRSGARVSSLISWVVIVGFSGALVVGLLVGPRRVTCFGTATDGQIARQTVAKYAFEAYPSFLAADPSRQCPVQLDELNPWMNAKDIRDPWGTPYTMICRENVFVVGSAGEDKKVGTSDDIWSNE